MLIDKQLLLTPLIAIDTRAMPPNVPLYVEQFSHLVECDSSDFADAKRVRKGSYPKLRYVKAVYKIVRAL